MRPLRPSAVLLVALTLTACASSEWARPETAGPEREDDLESCRAETSDRVSQAPWTWSPALAVGYGPSDPYPWGGSSRRPAASATLSVAEGSYFQDCMRARGYELGPAR